MNRRLFAAGMAAMIPATAAGQEASPVSEAASPSEAALWFLLRDVIRDGQYGGISDAIDTGYLDANAVIEDMVSIHNYANQDFTVWMVASDGNQAMAYTTIEDASGIVYNLFLHIAVDEDSGLIQSYRWAIGRYSS